MIIMMAWRNIWRNRTRSMVIMLSVSIGLLAGLGVLALYKGMMKSRVKTVVYSEVSHLQLHHSAFKREEHPAYVLPGGFALLKEIQGLPQVQYVTARSIVQGMLLTTTGSAGVQVNGVMPDMENKVSQLKEKLIAGRDFQDPGKNEIIIGKKLADKMKLKLNGKLVITFTDSADNLVSGAFRIRGIYQSGNTPRDELNVYVPIASLNELLLTRNAFHEIAILLKNDDDLISLQEYLMKKHPALLIESWKQLSPETELMTKTVDDYSYIILVIILIALAFGILNTMLMSVLERTKEIGMMVALGTSRAKIFLLVLLETVFLTVAGTPVGLAAAYLITAYFQKHGLDLSSMGKDMMSSFGFETMIYPSFPWDKLVALMIMVMGTALLSSLLPAWRALKLQPVEALRK